jgi:hypothetical protein
VSPRNFDQDLSEDLEFIVAGETFKMKYVRPEVLAAWEDEEVADKSETALRQMDERIKLFLDNSNGAIERWDTLRAREDNPVSMGQINDLLLWMVEVQSGRPTTPPSPSVTGRGKTAASSKAE